MDAIRVGALFALASLHCLAQVRHYAEMNTRAISALDRSKTVVIIPGAILEEHGPYLPAGTDGIINQHFANDLAMAIAAQRGWTAVLFPAIPLGAGAANEMGRKYSFPGSVTVRPSTLRTVFMDLGDQLAGQHFRWIFIVDIHGDWAHSRMLEQAGDYFHATYGGEMVNLFGYVNAMNLTDFRTPEERRKDGRDEHATMTETSQILALKPRLVAKDFKSAPPQTGQTLSELNEIATRPDWPGYFGAPSLASASLGRKIYAEELQACKQLAKRILAGEDHRKLPRYADAEPNDPTDAAADVVNRKLQVQ